MQLDELTPSSDLPREAPESAGRAAPDLAALGSEGSDARAEVLQEARESGEFVLSIVSIVLITLGVLAHAG